MRRRYCKSRSLSHIAHRVGKQPPAATKHERLHEEVEFVHEVVLELRFSFADRQ